MKTEHLENQQLVELIRTSRPPDQQLIDEYYRRCIPIYLDFIGIYWHTGFYLEEAGEVSPEDQTRMIGVVADSISLSEGERVLDVGCGTGSTACFLAQQYNAVVRGLTPVSEQQIIGEKLIRRTALEHRVTIDRGHAGALPYPDQSMDVVLFFESPCHFPDRALFFREAYRVLKPGGRLAGEDWLSSEHTGIPDPLLEEIARDWAIPALGSGETYRQLIDDAGFARSKYVDMRAEMALHRGFAVNSRQQAALQEEITNCPDPLLGMTLQGLLTLGKAVASGAFTIGRFSAVKPSG